MEHAVEDYVWENERFYLGFGWMSPTILERGGFTDDEGRSVTKPSSVISGGDWAVHVDSGTDLEGWQYGTSFERFGSDRSGGRASMRFTDAVRRRKWVRVSELDAALGRLSLLESQRITGHRDDGAHMAVPHESMRSSPYTNSAVLSRKLVQRTEATMRAVKGFLQLLHSALRERGLWGVPLDPVSYALLLRAHDADLRGLRERVIASHGGGEPDGGRGCASPIPADRSGGKDSPQAMPRRSRLHMRSPPSAWSSAMDDYVDSLRAASIYARAAYGYPLTEGYLSSVYATVFMGTLKSLEFDVVGGASAHAHDRALLEESGLEESDLLLSEWKNSVFRPCHFVATDRRRRKLILGVRGSLQLSDLLTDTMADTLEVSLAGGAAKVHEGMFRAATYVHCNTAEVLRRAAEEHPGWQLIVTGHSMGGGVAALLAVLLNEPEGCPNGLRGNIRCVALGCPSVMSSRLCRACASYVTSVVLRHDFVPRLGAASIDLLMEELVQASPMKTLSHKIGELFSGSSKADPSGRFCGSLPFPRVAPGEANLAEESEEAAASAAMDEEGWSVALPDVPFSAGAVEGLGSRDGQTPAPATAAKQERMPNPADLHADAAAGDAASHGAGGTAAARAFSASTGIPVLASCSSEPRGTSSLDLLYPAGTVLWVVEDGEAPNPQGASRGPRDEESETEVAAASRRDSLDGAPLAPPSSTSGCRGTRDRGAAPPLAAAAERPLTHCASDSDVGWARRLSWRAADRVGGGQKPNGSPAVARLKWEPVFLETPPEMFGRIHLHPEMINDHLPDLYADSVARLHAWYSQRGDREGGAADPGPSGQDLG